MEREHDIETKSDWKTKGIRVVQAGELDLNTTQTPGMTRAAALTHTRVGLNKLWAGLVSVEPNTKTIAHHHGEQETVIFVVRGCARYRWGDKLEYLVDAHAGDFIYIPPYVPHQEINASPDTVAEVVVVRSGPEPIVVNLDIVSPEV